MLAGMEGNKGNDVSESAYENFCRSTKNLDSLDKRSTDCDVDTKAQGYLPNHGDGEEREKGVWRRMFQSRWCKYADITITVLVIALLWIMMALPTVIYIDKSVRMKGKDDVNSSTCTLYPGSDRDHYTTYLQQYTNCLNNSTLNTLSVFVSSQLEPTAISETNQLISKLRSIVKNPQCLLNLEPLICLQFINLCGAEMNMGPIVPSKAQCDHALSVCGDQVLAKLIPILHLDVGKYNNVAYCAPESPLDNLTCNITTDVSTNSQQTVNCSEDFFYSDKRKGCIPECDGWTPFSSRVVLITDILTVFPAVVGVVAGVAVLLTSWARCRKLCRYPSIFVVYQTIPTVVLAVFVLVGVGARKRLFCRSRDLLESFKNPTPFCTISGVGLYYIMVQLLLWWLFHTIAVFRRVNWQFHSSKVTTSKKNVYHHFTFVLASLILPAIPVLVIMFVPSDYKKWLKLNTKGFTITRSPPFVCTGFDTHTNFWAAIFPVSLVLATGATILVLILRIVFKNHLLSKIYKIKVASGWTIELKVLLVLCYYVIIGAAVVTIFTNSLLDINSDIYLIVEYFTCEFGGLLPKSDYRCTDLELIKASIRSMLNPIPSTVAVVIIGFLPAVNLVYVVKLSDLKNKMKTYSQTRYFQYIQNGAYRAGHYLFSDMHKRTSLSRTPRTNCVNTEPLITPHGEDDSHC